MKKYLRSQPEELILKKLDEIINKLNLLAQKLDNDSGTTDTDYKAQLDDLKRATEELL